MIIKKRSITTIVHNGTSYSHQLPVTNHLQLVCTSCWSWYRLSADSGTAHTDSVVSGDALDRTANPTVIIELISLAMWTCSTIVSHWTQASCMKEINLSLVRLEEWCSLKVITLRKRSVIHCLWQLKLVGAVLMATRSPTGLYPAAWLCQGQNGTYFENSSRSQSICVKLIQTNFFCHF